MRGQQKNWGRLTKHRQRKEEKMGIEGMPGGGIDGEGKREVGTKGRTGKQDVGGSRRQ